MTTTNINKAESIIKRAIAFDELVYFKFQYYSNGFYYTDWLCPFYAFKWLNANGSSFYQITSKVV